MQMSLTFVGNAVSTSVWVAAVCLFLELLGFSTHKWLAAGGVGTVLLTLAGREVIQLIYHSSATLNSREICYFMILILNF